MISLNLAIALLIGTVLMAVPVLIQSRWYHLAAWKVVVATVLLTIVGTAGTYVLFFVENQRLGGISFYGAVFLVPILFILVAWLLRLPYGTLMDLCAPAECVMLAFMKIQCMMTGCCGGRVIGTTAEGNLIVFPSQIVELINGLLLAVILMFLAHRRPNRKDLYPLYMMLYGCTRFVLNFLRAQQSDFFLGMSPGNVWSIVAVLAGGVWLWVLYAREKASQG